MARGPRGAVLDEPPRTDRTEGAERSGAGRRSLGSEVRRRGSHADPSGGGRQARRTRLERRRFWLVLMPGVAVALALVVALGAVVRGDDGGAAAPARTAAPHRARASGTLLLGHRGADGRMDLLLLVGSQGSRSSVLMLPVATQVEVPSLGPQVLADLPNDGNPTLVPTTVGNLLGVAIANTVVLDDAHLNAVLATAAPIPVDLHRSVEFAGSEDAAIPAGPRRFPTGNAARLLVGRQPGSELDRLVTVQDVVDGWMRRLRDPSVARRTLAAQPGLAALVSAARAADRRTDTLPVQSVATVGGERFEARSGDVRRYVAVAFAGDQLDPGTRPRVEILNGTGAVGLAQGISAQVVPAGGQVTLTGNVPGFGVPKTQVVYYQSRDRAAARRMLAALGCGALKAAGTPIGVVDVTIIAGADCFPTGAPPGP